MAIRYRKVIGTLTTAKSGVPVSNATLSFVLTTGFGLTGTHLIPNEPVTTQTDEDGYFEIDLWCDEDALRAIDYNVSLPKESDGQPETETTYQGTFSLVYGDGEAIELSPLLIASTPNSTTTELLYQLIDARIIAVGGGGTVTGGNSILRFPCTPRLTPITGAMPNIYSELIVENATISEIIAYLVTPAANGIFTIDIKKNGTTILSTPLTVDATESSSLTAVAAAVLSNDSISKGDILSVSITDAADGTATGLFVYILTGTPDEVVADTTAPSVPTGLMLTPSPTSISATYADATDNIGVASYEFRINGGGLTNDIRTGGLAKPFVISGLNASTVYQVAIRAKDAAGNASAWSANQSATTTAAAVVETVIYRIDVGRDSGGVIDGWEENNGKIITPEANYNVALSSIDKSAITAPVPSDAVFNSIQYAVDNSDIHATFTGLASGSYRLRFLFVCYNSSSYSFDVTVNGDLIADNYIIGNNVIGKADQIVTTATPDGSGNISFALTTAVTQVTLSAFELVKLG